MSIFVSNTPIGDSGRLSLGPGPGDIIIDGELVNLHSLSRSTGQASRANRADRKDINTLKEGDAMTDKKSKELEDRISDLENRLESLAKIGAGESVYKGQIVSAAEAQSRMAVDADVDPAAKEDVALEDAKAEKAALDADREFAEKYPDEAGRSSPKKK